MKRIAGHLNEVTFSLTHISSEDLAQPKQYPLYTILYIKDGEGVFKADFGTFKIKGPVILFSTPLQVLTIKANRAFDIKMLQFHGDFYCIEYHRLEVACNGLLFNNIYIDPMISIRETDEATIDLLFLQVQQLLSQEENSDLVLKSCLQLFLAKSSSIKIKELRQHSITNVNDQLMEQFRRILEDQFLTLHKPSEYASILGITVDNLSRRSRRYFHKTPSQLIQDRLILEAKKMLHLTRLSIKEIAYELLFRDEYYFSRFFKKVAKVSPQAFRNRVGVSIIANNANWMAVSSRKNHFERKPMMF